MSSTQAMPWDYAMMIGDEAEAMRLAAAKINTLALIHADQLEDNEHLVLLANTLDDFVELAIMQHNGEKLDPKRMAYLFDAGTRQAKRVLFGLTFTLAELIKTDGTPDVPAPEREAVSQLTWLFALWLRARMRGEAVA